MVVMKVTLDNFLLFHHFTMDLSYPKKIVNSSLVDEYLSNRPNFRYKKLNIIMGANATGKTALGHVLMSVFNFIHRKEYTAITELIEDDSKEASFEIDLAFPTGVLYRVSAVISPKTGDEYESKDISIVVKSEPIKKTDNYERCVERLEKQKPKRFDNYIVALESVPYLTWMFSYPIVSDGKIRIIKQDDPVKYSTYLKKVLMILDPRIKDVVHVENTENTYIIMFDHHSVVIGDREIKANDILSSGTAEGIGIAEIITFMKMHFCDFYYCDEKFSHIHSDVEKAMLSLFIELLGKDRQLFFTSHNLDLLDMNLPKHSYTFLKRDNNNEISCVYASDFLKKASDSLKNAVDNDVFSTAPDVSAIYNLV